MKTGTVHRVETGINTETGGYISRLRRWLGDEPFMLTYGDGVADIDIAQLVAFHKSHGKLAALRRILRRAA